MKKLFNEDWILNPMDGYEMFMNPNAAKQEHQVTLPYDALQLETRRADVVLGRNTGFYPYEKATYVKRFDVPSDWSDKIVALEFEGVYMHAMVYINNHFAGSCPHGYTKFWVEATPFLRQGEENEIKVVCKMNMDSRWYSGLGIYRNVYLAVNEPVHIQNDGVKITTVDIVEGAVITVETCVENRSYKPACTRIVTTVKDEEGKIVAEESSPLTVYGNDTDRMLQRICIGSPQLWDTENPYLYQISVRLSENKTDAADLNQRELDCFTCSYGVRKLSLDAKKGLQINGKSVLLRGACVHHDNGLIGAADIARAEERRVQLLKAAGFNSVRSAHNPISRAFLDACDRYGMLVMDELTDMWTHRKGEWDYSTDFVSHWPDLCESIVAKDYNHCSVILYSIGNEIHETGTCHGAVIGRKLSKKLKELDPTRYTTNSVNLMMAAQGTVSPQEIMPELMAAGVDMSSLQKMISSNVSGTEEEKIDGEATGKKVLDINEIMQMMAPFVGAMVASDAVGEVTEETFASVDVAGYNYAASRYEKDGKRYPNRVIVGSESFPQDIAKNWEQVKAMPHLIGDFTWTGWDYIGEAGIGATNYEGEPVKEKYPWYLAWCGDLDITGKRRPVSYYREIVFGLRKDPYFAVRYPENYGKTRKSGGWDFVDGCTSWTWPGMLGQELEVEIYAPGDTAVVYINGRKAAEGNLTEYRTMVKVGYEPGEVRVVAYKNGKELGSYSMKTAGEPVAIRAEADRKIIRADTTDLCYVEIDLVDKEGIVNPAKDVQVNASVDGSGYLAGFGSAKPDSRESFLSGSFRSYQGHLLAVIRPKGAGEIRLTLSAEGFCDTVVKITAQGR